MTDEAMKDNSRAPLPCPFCGREPHAYTMGWFTRETYAYGCPCVGTFVPVFGSPSREDAAQAWNEHAEGEG